jgi:hypothetical protein
VVYPDKTTQEKHFTLFSRHVSELGGGINDLARGVAEVFIPGKNISSEV